MKKRIATFISLALILILHSGLIQTESGSPSKKATAIFLDEKEFFLKNIIDLTTLLNSVDKQKDINADSVKAKLLSCRLEYKKMEWAISYYYPSLAIKINGTDVIEEEEPTEFEPAHGMQVIENIVLGDNPDSLQLKLKDELMRLRVTVNNLNEAIRQLTGTNNSEILAALKYEIIKITATGFTEYDDPIMKNYLQESVIALTSVRDNLKIFSGLVSPALIERTDKLFDSATGYILKHNSIDKFNRLEFIVSHYTALSRLIDEYAGELKITYYSYSPNVNLNAKSIFDLQSFNYFFHDENKNTLAARVKLGRNLFFDPILSGNYERACASCHKPEKAFTDGLAKSIAFDESQTVNRNATTLLNSCMQVSFFDDSREVTLESQIAAVVNNPKELNCNFDLIVSRLNQSDEYTKKFNDAFPGEPISVALIKKAIADYEKTLIGFNSDFDKYLKGEKNKLSASQINGFNLFMGKAKCGSCHFFPLFNGLLPPFYSKSEFEIIGSLESNDFNHPHLDADEGVGTVKKAVHLKFGFKVPTLRNASLTAPYMHNGAMKTLADVLTFYNKGGGASFGLDIPNQTLSRDSLGLNKDQIGDIIHFIESLTDTTGLITASPVLPKLSANEKANQRVPGGKY